MRVTFDPRSRNDLERIFASIAENSPRAAREMISRIESKVLKLTVPGLAHMGRPGLVKGTRELIEWPFIIVYKILEDQQEIVIVTVVHGAQDRSNWNT